MRTECPIRIAMNSALIATEPREEPSEAVVARSVLLSPRPAPDGWTILDNDQTTVYLCAVSRSLHQTRRRPQGGPCRLPSRFRFGVPYLRQAVPRPASPRPSRPCALQVTLWRRALNNPDCKNRLRLFNLRGARRRERLAGLYYDAQVSGAHRRSLHRRITSERRVQPRHGGVPRDLFRRAQLHAPRSPVRGAARQGLGRDRTSAVHL